jgi:hypothetical protein
MPEEIWSYHSAVVTPNVASMPAYKTLAESGIDACGLTQLASRTVGVPFVGLIAAATSVAETLRRLHGADSFEFISVSAYNLDDIESGHLPFVPYGGGHVPACDADGRKR